MFAIHALAVWQIALGSRSLILCLVRREDTYPVSGGYNIRLTSRGEERVYAASDGELHFDVTSEAPFIVVHTSTSWDGITDMARRRSAKSSETSSCRGLSASSPSVVPTSSWQIAARRIRSRTTTGVEDAQHV